MRLKRLLADFRVAEELAADGDLRGAGPWSLYRVTKSGLTTPEAAQFLARSAEVAPSAVEYAGLKDKDAITTQYMTVLGGQRVKLREEGLAIEYLGPATRPLASRDNAQNSFELVLRDLSADDMRRVRINLLQLKRQGLPAYFDDQRFGCLRHGQGFIVRKLLRGDLEGALFDLFTAPSPYGAAAVERYKAEVARRWGDWGALARYARGGRGTSLFEYLHEHPQDWAGALRRGIATEERTIHLFAYQSHLWNHAAGLWIRSVTPPEHLAWLPSDDGALPVYRELPEDAYAALRAAQLPLYGPGVQLGAEAARCYEAVFRAEGVRGADFAALAVPGFRPQAEERPLLFQPGFARVAPAERDEVYEQRHKMRVKFHLPRGHYATLVAKRLLMPTEPGYRPLKLWVGRHALPYPDDAGQMRPLAPRPPSDSRGPGRSHRTHERSGPPRHHRR